VRLTSLYEIETPGWILEIIVVNPSGFGGNCAAIVSKRQAHRRIVRKPIVRTSNILFHEGCENKNQIEKGL